jgi:hypothetical protein
VGRPGGRACIGWWSSQRLGVVGGLLGEEARVGHKKRRHEGKWRPALVGGGCRAREAILVELPSGLTFWLRPVGRGRRARVCLAWRRRGGALSVAEERVECGKEEIEVRRRERSEIEREKGGLWVWRVRVGFAPQLGVCEG